MPRIFFFLAVAFLFVSCSTIEPNNPGIVYGTPVTYQGETYQTVVIGNQTWMARNLNYAVSGSKCYNDNESNCVTYGRLYDWATAMALPSSCNSSSCASQVGSKHHGICPGGWHIPSKTEWNALLSYVESNKGCNGCDARYLKSISGWYSNGNGTDAFGFSALPGGYDFRNVGHYGLWWSASESNGDRAYYRSMDYSNERADWVSDSKSSLLSVRCLQD